MNASRPILQSDEYRTFRERCAHRQVTVRDGSRWKFFDTGKCGRNFPVNGTEEHSTLICVPGTSGTGATFFRQLTALADDGYRVLAVDCVKVWTHKAWADGLACFMEQVGITKCHFYGCSLGGFLAQVFAFRYPERVLSLALTNAFNDTALFSKNAPCVRALRYMPDFYLKKYVLEHFPSGELEYEIGRSIQFQAALFRVLSQQEIASRLTLNCIVGDSVNVRRPSYLQSNSHLNDKNVSLIDSNDKINLPESLRKQLYDAFPGAHVAFIKSGGKFSLRIAP